MLRLCKGPRVRPPSPPLQTADKKAKCWRQVVLPGPRDLALRRWGPEQGEDTAWCIGSPCSTEWKEKGILAPGWSGHTKPFAEFPLAPEVQGLELEGQ